MWKGSKSWNLKSTVLPELFYYFLPPSDKISKFHKSLLLKSSHKNTPIFPSLSAFCKVAGYSKCFKNDRKVARQLPNITCNLYLTVFSIDNNQSQSLLSQVSWQYFPQIYSSVITQDHENDSLRYACHETEKQTSLNQDLKVASSMHQNICYQNGKTWPHTNIQKLNNTIV